jgi:formylglycine-generating enzyme required for sulfatase activity
MYLYLELWKAKDAWLQLSGDERQARIESVMREARTHPTGVIPFSFRALGDGVVFDGGPPQVVLDSAVARPTGFHYAAAWMVPTREQIETMENRHRKQVWWGDCFEQENAWGEMDGATTLADMLAGNAAEPSSGFEGSSAGEERDGFCWCPQGTFKMGYQGTDVTLTQGFWMAKYEVTQSLYRSIMGDNPSAFVGDSLPADSVNREQVVKFCRGLTSRQRAAGLLPEGWVYDLPTEAQWEYAACAGTTTAYPWGDDPGLADEYSWHMLNSGSMSHPVGTKKPNAWGLYDMLGNCLERCRDVWVDAYPGGADPNVTPDDVPARSDEADGRWGVCRGGGWFIPPVITARDRTRLHPGNQGYLLGFRVAIVRATPAKLTVSQLLLLDWGLATMGHWVTDLGPFDATAPGGQGLFVRGSSSARFLRGENALQGQFQVFGLTGNFVTMWDRDTDQIMQHTVNSDGGSGVTIIARQSDNVWTGTETASYPDGSHASSTDIVTLSDGRNTMEHHITKRTRDGESLPEIKFVLHKVSN